MRSVIVLLCTLLLGALGVLAQAPAKNFTLTQVKILPAPGQAALLKDCRVTGSNQNQTNGFIVLATVTDTPAGDEWITVPVQTDKVYKYVKIEAALGVKLTVAEVEFYGKDGKFAGAAFGTAGPKDAIDLYKNAFDGDPATVFTAPIDGAYTGIDLGKDAQCPNMSFPIRSGVYKDAQKITIHQWPPMGVIHYTTDGTVPTATTGTIYTGPFMVEKNTTIIAIGTQVGRADSPLAYAFYTIGEAAANAPLVKSYHIGNSLTDTVVGWMEPLAFSGGKNYKFIRKTIPGCGLEGNWESNGKGFGDTDYKKVLADKVDHLFLQVFPNPPGLKRDGDAGINFTKLAREGNKDAQVWLYAQWPSYNDWKNDAHCMGAGWMTPNWFPTNRAPKDWEEAMANKMEYYKTIFDIWVKEDAGKENPGKPIRLCPGGPALVKLKHEMEAGKIPGMTDFGKEAFASDKDKLHVSGKAAYLVSMVHYACIFGESPEGKVTAAGSGLTPEQAAIFQRIAWETVINEPLTGITAPIINEI